MRRAGSHPETTVSRDSSLKALNLSSSPSPDSGETADPADLSLGESADGDDDLERGFFSRGLSDEHLLAASERQGEPDLFRPPGARRRRRIAIGFCGVVVAIMVGLGIRNFFADRTFGPAADSTPLATVKTAPTPAPPPSPETMPPELVPPVGSLERVVSIDQLRARVPEGPALAEEPAAPAAAEAPEGAPGTEATQLANAAPAADPAGKSPGQSGSNAAPAADPAGKAPGQSAWNAGSNVGANVGSTAGSIVGPSVAAPAAAAAGTRAATAPTATTAVAEVKASPQVAACTGVLRSGRYRDIESKCKVAFDAQPAAPLAVEVAQAALEQGRNAEAAAWARKAIGVDPKHAEAFALLGGAEQQLGRSADARAAYARYLELAPNGPHAQDIRALLPRLAGM
jgi:hypothetical protein